MEKLFLLLIISLIIGQTNAQKKLDEAYLKCVYEYAYQRDTLSNDKLVKDILHLQIGEKINKCYSYYTYHTDSLWALPNGTEIIGQKVKAAIVNGILDRTKIPSRRLTTYVYKNHPEGKMTVTDDLTFSFFQYEDKLNAQEWEVRDSTKSILEHTCQLATCNFRGRQWSAWFTTEIPISDGPWKLGGLPGLIMEAYDKKDQYHFVITGLQQAQNEPIAFTMPSAPKVKKFEKTTREKFLKAKNEYLHNSMGHIKMETGIDLGDHTTQKIRQYDLIERDYK